LLFVSIDGSNAGTIAVYYADTTTIESFKWHENHDEATKVRAIIDPMSLTVQEFRAFHMADR
jgi:hypothetical protein